MATDAKKFGLKEVANVKFYEVGNTTHTTGDVKFSFDTLKVSNIEVASEDTSATGGQGNPELLSWSYGKTVTFTMEDALVSMDTLSLLFGGTIAGSGEEISLTVNADTFPGNYDIVGETWIRSNDDGKDYAFDFEIYKGKVNAAGTLTMQADGDPSTFELTIKALKTDSGLVKFQRHSTTKA